MWRTVSAGTPDQAPASGRQASVVSSPRRSRTASSSRPWIDAPTIVMVSFDPLLTLVTGCAAAHQTSRCPPPRPLRAVGVAHQSSRGAAWRAISPHDAPAPGARPAALSTTIPTVLPPRPDEHRLVPGLAPPARLPRAAWPPLPGFSPLASASLSGSSSSCARASWPCAASNTRSSASPGLEAHATTFALPTHRLARRALRCRGLLLGCILANANRPGQRPQVTSMTWLTVVGIRPAWASRGTCFVAIRQPAHASQRQCGTRKSLGRLTTCSLTARHQRGRR